MVEVFVYILYDYLLIYINKWTRVYSGTLTIRFL